MRKTRALLILALAGGVLFVACKKDDPDPPADPGPTHYGTPYSLQIPSNFPPMDIPADDPMTQEGVALGRYLFYEERLSANNAMSCSTCHAPANAFTDGLAVSTGIDGIAGTRSAMALINLGWGQRFFWDGRAHSLEEQVLQPVINPIEMHETWPGAISKLQSAAGYPALFTAAFGPNSVDSVHAAKALAQFLRTMISGNSKYDQVRRGETQFTVAEATGYTLFLAEGGPVGEQIPLPGGGFVVGQGGADCFHCHSDAAGLFTDEQFHNNALDTDPFPDPGLGGITGDPADLGKFKVPTLRNIMLSAPYMHDGRFATIDEVIAHYNDGGHPSSTLDPFMKFTDQDLTLGLTSDKITQLKAFLSALTDMDFVNNPAFADPGTPQ